MRGSGERLHGMQEVTGSIPVFSTKKALYFVGSMVLFFLLKPIFGELHCFACAVFRLLQAVPIQPPTFDFTPFLKKNVCRPAFQQAAASSPSIYGVRSKLKVMLSRFTSQRKAKCSRLNPSSLRIFLIRSPTRDASPAGSDSG